MFHYSAYNLAIASEIRLPELPVGLPQEGLNIRLAAAKEPIEARPIDWRETPGDDAGLGPVSAGLLCAPFQRDRHRRQRRRIDGADRCRQIYLRLGASRARPSDFGGRQCGARNEWRGTSCFAGISESESLS